MSTSRYVVDPIKLFDAIKNMPPDKMKTYMLNTAVKMIDGEAKEDWLKKDKSVSASKYSEAFETFWKAYPSRKGMKQGKATAYRAWKKIKIDENELLSLCLKAIEIQKKSDQWTNDRGAYIPMAATYLNNWRWEDEIEEQEEQQGYMDMDGIVR